MSEPADARLAPRRRAREALLGCLLLLALGVTFLLPVLRDRAFRRVWKPYLLARTDPPALIEAGRSLLRSVRRPQVLLRDEGSGSYQVFRRDGVPVPAAPALPKAILELQPTSVTIAADHVELAWPLGRGAPTLYGGFTVYAVGAKPAPPGRPDEGWIVDWHERLRPGLWAFERQGDQ